MKITSENIHRLNITTRLIVNEALSYGYEVQFMPSTPSSKSGIVICSKNDREIVFKSLNTMLTPSFAVYAAEDKYQTLTLLSSVGIPMPESQIITPDTDMSYAERFLDRKKIVVVKPVASNHGNGVTVGVTHVEDLRLAIERARSIPSPQPDVLVQEMVYGEEYRFLVLNGRVIAVATRRPPSVRGDGKSTIRQLIIHKNKDPRRGEGHSSALTRIDIDEVERLNPRDFLDIVVPKNEIVDVLKTSNLSRGGDAVDCTNIASKELKKMAIDAARICHLGIAGVDIITKNIEGGGVKDSFVLEVNVSPGIRMHQFPTYGKPRNVAKIIFKQIEKTSRPVGKHMRHIGRSEKIRLPDLTDKFPIHARIDTGATISTIGVSNIRENDEGLTFQLFYPEHPLYDGKDIQIEEFSRRSVSSSMGHVQTRYMIKTTVNIARRTINAKFTLADRSKQAYPVLIGRNILRNKFIVDVGGGSPDVKAEQSARRRIEEEKNV